MTDGEAKTGTVAATKIFESAAVSLTCASGEGCQPAADQSVSCLTTHLNIESMAAVRVLRLCAALLVCAIAVDSIRSNANMAPIAHGRRGPLASHHPERVCRAYLHAVTTAAAAVAAARPPPPLSSAASASAPQSRHDSTPDDNSSPSLFIFPPVHHHSSCRAACAHLSTIGLRIHHH